MKKILLGLTIQIKEGKLIKATLEGLILMMTYQKNISGKKQDTIMVSIKVTIGKE